MMLPRVVYQMCVHGALLVGSRAKALAERDKDITPNDWDLLVPFDKWQVIALLIPQDARPNKFGGWRFEVESFDGDWLEEVDVWPGSLETYLRECKTKYGGAVVAVDFIHNKMFTSEGVDV